MKHRDPNQGSRSSGKFTELVEKQTSGCFRHFHELSSWSASLTGPLRTSSFGSFQPPNSDAAADPSGEKTLQTPPPPRTDGSLHPLTRCFGRGYSRPRSGEAHGQQHVQAGAAFDGARPVLAQPPREDLAVDVLLGSHGPLSGLLPAPVPSAGERERSSG